MGVNLRIFLFRTNDISTGESFEGCRKTKEDQASGFM
jgi:hypothetical protein